MAGPRATYAGIALAVFVFVFILIWALRSAGVF